MIYCIRDFNDTAVLLHSPDNDTNRCIIQHAVTVLQSAECLFLTIIPYHTLGTIIIIIIIIITITL